MIELYINQQLCDIENPNNFSIALKRVFLNPSELNTKDAQKSYNITLPATANNNQIFGFKNIEEVKGKFDKIYDAVLNIKGVRIFTGKFRLSEITKDSYKGNLGVPAAKTVKDIFGDTLMSEAGSWRVKFDSYPTSINEYNNMANAPCIFPYVLYGLLPKTKNQDGFYTNKKVWDSNVRLSLDDFPPSINCLQAIKNIFKSKGFVISGSAFNDDRLTKLYMSYKNPTDYELKWNYRGLESLELNGNVDMFYKIPFVNDDSKVANYDIMAGSTPKEIGVIDKTGNLYDRRSGMITTPVSGVYEIELNGSITLDNGSSWSEGIYPLNKDLYYYSANSFSEIENEYAFELKIIKHSDSNTILTDIGIDRKFGEPNIYQNNSEWSRSEYFPKYFPKPNKTMLIDASQNDKFVIGFGCGKNDLPQEAKAFYSHAPNTMILANGWSWNPKYNQTEQNYITSNIEGYLEASLENNRVSIYRSTYNERIIDNFNLTNSASYSVARPNMLSGSMKAYVYLKKGEKLSLVSSSSLTDKTIQLIPYKNVIRGHIVNFNLKVKPIFFDKNYVNTLIDASDKYIEDKSDMLKDEIDLVQFLPSEQKVDDWLDNFCKAFNLQLSQTSANAFELNTKQDRRLHRQSTIDLDSKANVNIDRTNTSLNLPSVYEIGFTVNQDEQGYIESGEDGSGTYYTGNTEGSKINQKSNFSFNWFKNIQYIDDDKDIEIQLPIISDKEVWAVDSSRDYSEMMQKTYTNLAQRFWYKGDILTVPRYGWGQERKIDIALVKNSIEGVINMNYYNRPLSILSNYFTVLVNNNTDYTTVSCIITPEEYNRLANSYIRFNGDLYYIAEIDEYDPTGKSNSKLKLIKKIL